MKQHPTDGAHLRARDLRKNLTDAEKALWRLISSRQIDSFRFRRQVPIGRYIADFVCHQARLVIEVDGGQHVRDSEKEISRTDFLRSQGYEVLRFWNDEVLSNPEGVYSVIAQSLSRASPPPNPPPSRGRA